MISSFFCSSSISWPLERPVLSTSTLLPREATSSLRAGGRAAVGGGFGRGEGGFQEAALEAQATVDVASDRGLSQHTNAQAARAAGAHVTEHGWGLAALMAKTAGGCLSSPPSKRARALPPPPSSTPAPSPVCLEVGHARVAPSVLPVRDKGAVHVAALRAAGAAWAAGPVSWIVGRAFPASGVRRSWPRRPLPVREAAPSRPLTSMMGPCSTRRNLETEPRSSFQPLGHGSV
jgi:hypothetical protein